VDIAKRANAEPNEIIMGLLKKGGIEPTGKLQLKHVLNHLAETQGYKATARAISIHHQSGVGAGEIPGQATRDLQLLRSESNLAVVHAESRIRKAVSNNLTPSAEDITKLKNLGASIKVGGKTFGVGSQTAIGGFKEIEKYAEEKIGKWKPQDFKKFKTYIKQIGCPGRLASQGGGDIDCFALGKEKIKIGNIKTPGEKANFRKLSKIAGGIKKLGAWLFGPIEMGTLPLWLAGEGLYAQYANKRDLDKALDKMDIPQYKKNLLLEGYRQEARDIGGVGLEDYAIDKPNISVALEKIGYGDKDELRRDATGAIADVRQMEAEEEAARYEKFYPRAQRERFDRDEPMFAEGGIASLKRK